MKKERTNDSFLNINAVCKEQSLDIDFVRGVSASPEFSVFMASKQQFTDIERICTNTVHFCVL